MANLLTTWFHSRTADICGDYPPRSVVNHPTSRPLMRCLITVVMMMGGGCLIVLLATIYSEKTRTARHWDGAAYMLNQHKNAVKLGPANADYSCTRTYSNATDTVCPCQKAFIPWPLFVKFYWVDKDLQRVPITNNTQFCDPLDANVGTSSAYGLWLQGCYDMGKVAFDVNSSRLTLSSSFLQWPEDVSYSISSNFRSYIDNAFLNYQVLAVNYSRDWLQLHWVSELLQNVASRPFVLSSRLQCTERAVLEKVLDELFWNHTRYQWMRDPRHKQQPITNLTYPEKQLRRQGAVSALQLTRQHAITMELNWTAYVDWCSPLYCDEVIGNPISRRLLTTMSQAGGLAAIVLLVVRTFLWPFLQRLLHFHHDLLLSRTFSKLPHPPPQRPMVAV